ncbi:cobalt ABC transporter permease, partial [Salmonella enterica subsp. enterica serovar Oranienburg]|nr:cobalt ABC transporter permease [Salmonella enterica subsp. enterica serovar Oranienburg]
PSRDKPLLVIVLEWFTCQHSIYRTHSSTMRALRKHFHVAGIGLTGATDDVTQAVFDEFTEVPAESAVHDIVVRLAELRPDV